MASRVDRLEKLADLRASGALTDAEYDREKAKLIDDTDRQEAAQPHRDDASPDTSEAYGQLKDVSGVRRVWLSSPLGQNKPLALLLVVLSSVVVGLLIKSALFAGVWLSGFSILAYYLYAGSRAEQQSKPPKGMWMWQAALYLGCAVVIASFFVERIPGQKESSISSMSDTQKASGDDSAVSSQPETDTTAQNAPMSCKSAMEIAAVASCGIELNKYQGSNSFDPSVRGTLAGRIGGYEKSMRDVEAVSDCQQAVSTGKAAGQSASTEMVAPLADHEIDIDTAVRMCGVKAEPMMDSYCEGRTECR